MYQIFNGRFEKGLRGQKQNASPGGEKVNPIRQVKNMLNNLQIDFFHHQNNYTIKVP